MRGIYYIKTTLKSMISNGVVTIAYFILFPILIAAFMAFFQDQVHENPLKLKDIKVQIIDEDDSEMSSKLAEVLKGKDLKEFVNVVNKDADIELVINKGYEKKLLALDKGNIVINKLEDGRELAIDTLKTILDKYHENMYVAISGGNTLELNNISTQSIIDEITIDKVEGANTYEKIIASMLGFVISMLMFNLIQSCYLDISINLDKRINSTPITKLQYLIYDTLALFVYAFIILSAYVFFFRIVGLSFQGKLLDLIIILLTGTTMVVLVAKSISYVFGAKYGKVIGSILFIIPLISGEMFLGEGNKISILSPTHYLNNAFSIYNSTGSIDGTGKWLLIILGVSVAMYLAAIIKASIKRGKSVCV